MCLIGTSGGGIPTSISVLIQGHMNLEGDAVKGTDV
jgi:hypothetical protein